MGLCQENMTIRDVFRDRYGSSAWRTTSMPDFSSGTKFRFPGNASYNAALYRAKIGEVLLIVANWMEVTHITRLPGFSVARSVAVTGEIGQQDGWAARRAVSGIKTEMGCKSGCP